MEQIINFVFKKEKKMKTILSKVMIFSLALLFGSGILLPNNVDAKNKFIFANGSPYDSLDMM